MTAAISALMLISLISVFQAGTTSAQETLTVSNWTEYAENPVFDPEEKAYYPTILFDGTTCRMWYADATGIRYTTSSDGITWENGVPVTGLTNANHPLVEYIDGKYMIWYWNTSQLYSISAIRYAESTDGITWENDQPLTQVGTTVIAASGWNRGTYGPCDVLYNPAGSDTIVEPVDATSVWANKFVMYYDGTTGGDEAIGLAVSADGKLWRGYNNGVAPVLAGGGSGAWDEKYVSRCTVLKNGDTYHMLYSGGAGRMDHGIGHATSADGLTWTKNSNNPYLHKNDGVLWRSDRTYCPAVIKDGGVYKMWFSGKDTAGNYAIGYATNTNLDAVYDTIQAAIDAASPGDTVLVYSGTYSEEIIIAKDNLVLQSDSELGAIIRPPTTPANHGAAIYISADGVTVDGFEIDGTTVCKNGIYGWETSCLTIKNNKIHGAVNAWDGCGILLMSWGNSGTVYNNLIENNEVYDTGRMGIMVMDHGGPILEDWGPYTVTSGNIITGNIVHDVWKVAWGDHGGGIQINVAKNCSITNNEVYNVQNNQRGIYIFGSATGNTITSNTLRDNPIGIQLWISGEGGTTIDWGDDTPASPQIRYNNIYNNGTGAISSNIAGTPMVMDAALNWWGNPTGPYHPDTNPSATGDDVSDNVDYTPWLNAPYPTGIARSWNVRNVNTGKNFNSIQAAIDNASPGDTIKVAAGTYNEQVFINKQLTLNGANADVNAVTGTRGSESIIDGATSTAITTSADNVIVDGFTLDGGITLDDKTNTIRGGTISNNIITGADSSEEPTKAQNGIRLGWDTGQGVDGVTIENNTISNSLEKGIRFANPKFGGGTASNITISGNEIKNNGSAGMETYGPGHNTIINNIISGNDGNGINLKFDNGDVVTGNIITNNTGPGITLRQTTDTTVENNSVSGHLSQEVINTCPAVVGGKGSGIHIFDTSVGNTIRFNDISGNNYGIFIHSKDDLQPSGNSIEFNNISGNNYYGLLNALSYPPTPVNATLNWWGDPSGPSGVGLGTGDNVSENVNYYPWLPRPLPTISDISVSGVTTTSATITWTTALPADSRVEYGPTIAYGLTSSISDLTTSHSLGLTGLTPSTTYHFRVRSEDAYGHMDNSGDLTFITATPPPPATLTIGTTPIKANVYVDGSLWGVAPRTGSLAAGTCTISFGDVLGYLPPAPEIVTLAAGETRTVTGVYTEIPPENIENQSPTYDLPSITPKENTTILVENTVLTEITIQVENAAENVKITVQEVTEGTAGIAIGAPGTTYKYLNIVAENITDAQIESVVIRFKVEKSWIIANDIDIATITLNHYDPLTDEWTSLPTTYLSEDDTYVYFSAISPGLSIFGVSGSTTIPANFELSNLVITPSEVSVGETVTISVVVNNAGGRTGSTTVTLEINGAEVDTRSATLDAGESTTVTFTVSEDVAGTYTVNVAGLTGSFVVTAPPAPPIVPLAVSVIIIVLAVGIVLWLRRVG